MQSLEIDNGNSLPTVEELQARSDRHITTLSEDRDAKSKTQKILLIAAAVGIILLIGCVIGLSVGLSKNNDEGTAPLQESDKVDVSDTPGSPRSPNNFPSMSPINAPTAENRFANVVEFLKDFVDEADLKTTGSPQQRAANWMANDDPLKYSVPSGDENPFKFIQRYVLTLLNYAFEGEIADDGVFLQPTDECGWNILTIYPPGEAVRYGASCSRESGKVSQIFLFEGDLSGKLPSEIGLLDGLELLFLYGNAITGNIPSEIGNLKKLKRLYLQNNILKGTIPTEMGAMTDLWDLNLFSNFLGGDIPSEVGLLTDLQFLNLGYNIAPPVYNGLVGELPDTLGDLTSLVDMRLGRNSINGTIGSWISKLTNLDLLRLSNNQVSKSIPDSFFELTNLTAVFLDDNKLTGQVSHFGSLVKLEGLFLEDNMFEETLDDSFLEDLSNLLVLDMSNNKLDGSLPVHLLDNGSNVFTIDLHHNFFGQGGESLPEFPNNTNLHFLALHNNSFGGMLPQSISNLSGLVHLDLSDNNLSGDIPTELGLLSKLDYLFLANNDFDQGPFPELLRNLTEISELSLKDTQRVGKIPDWIDELGDLLLLDLDQNGFTGKIPESMGNLTKLRFLLLNRNELTGPVPTGLGEISDLLLFTLDDNDLTGDVSDTFCEGENGNNLTGSLDILYSDCGGDQPQILCPCCNLCCNVENTICNDNELLANFDPIWEVMYSRQYWFFHDTDPTLAFNKFGISN